MKIYDQNGQPYEADLVPGPEHRALQADLAAAREALERALPVLEDYAEDESVFWGGASHYIAKDAIEVFEQARAALAATKEGA